MQIHANINAPDLSIFLAFWILKIKEFFAVKPVAVEVKSDKNCY